jgi:DNA-binding GntR family transcriptional regulator
MNPWAITIAAIEVAVTATGITGLATWWALTLRRKHRRLEAAYHDEHLTVAAYQAAFGDFLNTLTSTDGEQP